MSEPREFPVHCEKCGQAKWLASVFAKVEAERDQLKSELELERGPRHGAPVLHKHFITMTMVDYDKMRAERDAALIERDQAKFSHANAFEMWQRSMAREQDLERQLAEAKARIVQVNGFLHERSQEAYKYRAALEKLLTEGVFMDVIQVAAFIQAALKEISE